MHNLVNMQIQGGWKHRVKLYILSYLSRILMGLQYFLSLPVLVKMVSPIDFESEWYISYFEFSKLAFQQYHAAIFLLQK